MGTRSPESTEEISEVSEEEEEDLPLVLVVLALMFARVIGTAPLETAGPTTSPAALAASSAAPSRMTADSTVTCPAPAVVLAWEAVVVADQDGNPETGFATGN